MFIHYMYYETLHAWLQREPQKMHIQLAWASFFLQLCEFQDPRVDIHASLWNVKMKTTPRVNEICSGSAMYRKICLQNVNRRPLATCIGLKWAHCKNLRAREVGLKNNCSMQSGFKLPSSIFQHCSTVCRGSQISASLFYSVVLSFSLVLILFM